MNNEEEQELSFFKKMFKKHWKIGIIFIIGGAVAIIGLILVFTWIIETSDIGGQGSWTFNDWSMGALIVFILIIIGFELLIVVLPTAVFIGGVGYLWWSKLPDEEKEEIKSREKEKKTRKYEGGAGGMSFFIFIVFLIIVFIDGNWNVNFGSLSYSYFIYAYLAAVFWIFIIIGIPVLIVAILWFRGKLKEVS